MAATGHFTLAPFAVLALAVAGCGEETAPASPDHATVEPASDLAAAADLAAPDGAAPLEAVAHARELRAVWVATVNRLDFPSSTSLTPAQARAELQAIVDRASGAGLNAIFFQVRPESDALYASTLEPWSRFLTGTQGTDPGYDPLAILLEFAHAAGVEVHAWLNPYRAQAGTGAATASNHVTKRFPSAAITYGSSITMDPADAAVRAHVIAVVSDLVQRYDVDGVVFDDYFYPYPTGTPFPDAASYSAYSGGGGTLGKSDWRRANVNALISGTAAAVRGAKSWVRFGVSPFGIYRPGIPAGVTGLDAYEDISCDPVHWMAQGWVDYLSPQLYWTSVSSGQPFGLLIDWWASIGTADRPVFAALALHNIGTSAAWTLAEMETQVTLARAEPHALGQTLFRDQFLKAPTTLAKLTALYAQPARPPVVPGAKGATVEPPSATVGGEVALAHAAPATIRGYAIYAGGILTRWVPATTSSVALTPGDYVISAIDRGGNESLGTALAVP